MLSAHLELILPADVYLGYLDASSGLAVFGLCRIDIEELTKQTEGRSWVEFWPTAAPLGEAHVRIHGCDELEVQVVLARIAELLRAPRDLRA